MSSSAILRTDAITLRIAPFSNTSHVVTWLTPSYGKIATVIKGACRPKSPVFGQYDIGFRCELLYYERDRNGIHILKECATLDGRHACRGQWQHTAAMAYCCHLATIATPQGAHAPELYQLLKTALSHIARQPASASRAAITHLLWFELQLLEQLGLTPQLHRCTICNRTVTAKPRLAFSTPGGGLVCDVCDGVGSTPTDAVCSGDVLTILRRWQTTAAFQALTTLRCTMSQLKQAERLLGNFLTHHLDLAPECRAVTYQMMRTTLP